jgi:hypothetical protein
MVTAVAAQPQGAQTTTNAPMNQFPKINLSYPYPMQQQRHTSSEAS